MKTPSMQLAAIEPRRKKQPAVIYASIAFMQHNKQISLLYLALHHRCQQLLQDALETALQLLIQTTVHRQLSEQHKNHVTT